MEQTAIPIDKVDDKIVEIHKVFFGEVDPSYDPKNDPLTQAIFRSHEIKIADYLMSLKDKLTAEFLKGNTLVDVITKKGRNVIQKKADRPSYMGDHPDKNSDRFPDLASEIVRQKNTKGQSMINPESWRNVELKYHDPFNNIHWDMDKNFMKETFPTAYKILDELGDDCPIASYSCLAPNSSIHRHTGPENRLGEYIRIHIPLIIPEGDLFFEVNGEEVNWSDLFGFDNQLPHSAHNFSNEYRLIFLIDIKRSRIGLPNAKPWSKDRQLYYLNIPFVRKND